MSAARHARPRPKPAEPVGPIPRGRHRAASRPAPLHPAVIGTAAAVVAVGGVVTLRGDGDPLRDVPAITALDTARASSSAGITDSAAASRSGTRVSLKSLAPATPAERGTGRHRKAERAATGAGASKAAGVVTSALRPTDREVPGPPVLRRACGYSASAQRTPDLTRAQKRNARTIVDVAQDRGLPPRAAVIALATAQQESELLNLNYGDRDSLGLFQQRPSMGWGSPRQVRTPEYAANKFYAALADVDGWRRLPLTVAAQRVQRSAFPDAYARWELLAATVVDDLLEVPDAALSCARD